MEKTFLRNIIIWYAIHINFDTFTNFKKFIFFSKKNPNFERFERPYYFRRILRQTCTILWFEKSSKTLSIGKHCKNTFDSSVLSGWFSFNFINLGANKPQLNCVNVHAEFQILKKLLILTSWRQKHVEVSPILCLSIWNVNLWINWCSFYLLLLIITSKKYTQHWVALFPQQSSLRRLASLQRDFQLHV